MATTYEAIQTTTLGSAAADITFSSIAASWTDLVLILSTIATTGGTQIMHCRVGNGSLDTASNYSDTFLTGDGSTASSGRNTSVTSTGNLVISSAEWCNTILNFQNYSNATTYKSILGRSNIAGWGLRQGVSLWRSTSAINTIQLFADGGANFATGTQATLYGILAA